MNENWMPEERGNSREVSCEVSTELGSCDLNVLRGINAFSVFVARNKHVRMRCFG